MNANALTAMTANVNVGMEDLVAIFVTKYETALHDKKKVLQDSIRALKGKIESLVRSVEQQINKADFSCEVPALGVMFSVYDVKAHFSGDHYQGKKGHVSVFVEMIISDKKYSREYSMVKYVAISEQDVAIHQQLNSELEQQNAELLSVMNDIKSVSRKEREVRGRISEMKVQQSGLSELLNNPELQQLVQLK